MQKVAATKFTPYLYCLMRTDMDSLNPGKAIAQGIHAGHVFTYQMNRLKDQYAQVWTNPIIFREYEEMKAEEEVKTHGFYNQNIRNLTLFKQWEMTSLKTAGFGTTITLDIRDEKTLLDTVTAVRNYGYPAGVAHDDEYPVGDGEITHLVPLNTCGYAFGDKDELAFILGHFELHF